MLVLKCILIGHNVIRNTLGWYLIKNDINKDFGDIIPEIKFMKTKKTVKLAQAIPLPAPIKQDSNEIILDPLLGIFYMQ